MTIKSGINFGSSIGGSTFDSRPEQRRGWFRIIHVKSTKKVLSILILGKKNAFLGLLYLEAKEIMQIA
jgi:hypothetical protein